MAASDFWAQKIAQHGELMPISRAAKLPSTSALSTQIKFFARPIGPDRGSSFGLEGSLNYTEAKPHAFYCAAGAQLAVGFPVAAGDRIFYNGESYKIVTVIPYRDKGLTLASICVAALFKAGK